MAEAADASATAAPDPSRHVAAHVFNLAMLLVGGGALAWMLHSFGWSQLREVFTDVGWWFGVVLALDVLITLFDAKALYAFLLPEAAQVSYWRVVAAQISGHAINVLTPGGALGEATKLTMLDPYAPKARVLSSIVLFNLVGLYVSVAVIVVGTPITLLLVDLPHGAKVLVGIGLAVLVPLMAGVALLVHRGALATLTGTARRLHLISKARAEEWKPKLADVDRHIAELARDRSAGTYRGIAWVCASKLATWVSSFVIIAAVGVHVHPALVVGVLSIGTLIGWISSVVPLGLGLADGANYALYDLLGASGAHGVFVTVIGRARMVAIGLVGLVVFLAMHASERFRPARPRRR
jgi:hypothetical protein